MSDVSKFMMVVTASMAMALSLTTGTVRAEDKRIAVVNVSNVFLRYNRVKAVQDKLAKEYKPMQDTISAKERDLKLWKEKLEQEAQIKDPKKDKGLFNEQLKLQSAVFDFQNEYEDLLKAVEERRKNEMKLVLVDIRRAINTIGKQEKFDLVLRAPENDAIFDPVKADPNKKDAQNEPQSAAELVRQFRDNPVLYFASGTDITDKVIDMLNNDYKEGK